MAVPTVVTWVVMGVILVAVDTETTAEVMGITTEVDVTSVRLSEVMVAPCSEDSECQTETCAVILFDQTTCVRVCNSPLRQCQSLLFCRRRFLTFCNVVFGTEILSCFVPSVFLRLI